MNAFTQQLQKIKVEVVKGEINTIRWKKKKNVVGIIFHLPATLTFPQEPFMFPDT